MSWFLFLLGFCIIISWQSYASTDKILENKFVLFFVDGFRHDYVKTIPNLSGFKDIIDNGVTTDYVTPIVPSTSFANQYTILTGLFAESHGFVGNNMYDDEMGIPFSYYEKTHNYSFLPKWWNGTEPIWITAEKQQVKTAVYFWPGAHIKSHKTSPHYVNPNRGYRPIPKLDFLKNMDDIILKFKNNEVQMSFIFYKTIDMIGHSYGPLSNQLNNTVLELNELLVKFREKLKDNKLDNNVNLIIISDHGMTPISENRSVKLYENADIVNNCIYVSRELALAYIRANESQVTALYQNLTNKFSHAKVYLKKDIPEEWHYKKNKRSPDLFILADEGYSLLIDNNTWTKFTFNDSKYTGKNRTLGGMHGYDNNLPSMRAFFAAVGPDFKKGYVNKPFNQVDAYNIFCKIAKLQPMPNNGTWTNVQDMLNLKSGVGLSNRRNALWIFFLSTIMTVTSVTSPFLRSI